MNEMIRGRRIVAANKSAHSQDTIELDFNQRYRRRMRMITTAGREFLLDLPSAVALRDGDCVELDDGALVTIRAKPERVADIFADNSEQLVRIAWHLGNRHLRTQIFEDRLRILNDHVIVEMLKGLGARVDEHDAPFQPEGDAYRHTHE